MTEQLDNIIRHDEYFTVLVASTYGDSKGRTMQTVNVPIKDFIHMLATTLTNSDLDELVKLRTGEPRLAPGSRAQ